MSGPDGPFGPGERDLFSDWPATAGPLPEAATSTRAGTPRRRRSWRSLGFPLAIGFLGVLLGVIVVLFLLAAGVPAPWEEREALRPPVTTGLDGSGLPGGPGTPGAPDPTVADSEQAAILGDATYLVGRDITPGRYRTADRGLDCRWVRLGTATEGGLRPILAKGTGRRAPIVTIRRSDAAFRTVGCSAWVRQ